LGSLGQLGSFGGPAAGFTDPGPKDPKTVDAGFTDKPKDGEVTDKPKDAGADDKAKTVDAGFTDEPKNDNTTKDEAGTGDKVQPISAGPEVRTAPVGAAPATAPAVAPVDAGRSVVLPDGTPVTASNEKAAAATRAVLGGTDVTAAYQAQGVQIPPPGTPVTSPVDPSRLEPGDIARFEGRPPVMAAGNGKVWMDGQLQPLSAMGSAEDFLGWSRPTGAPPAVLTSADGPGAVAAVTPPMANRPS
jgi:murein DD-endopeptidase MepM/ murein hydrolase activator NlpD